MGEKQDGRDAVDRMTKHLVGAGNKPKDAREMAERAARRNFHGECIHVNPKRPTDR